MDAKLPADVDWMTVHTCGRGSGDSSTKLPAIREAAAGRPWAWLDDGIDDLGPIPGQPDGVLVRLDPRRGIIDVDPGDLLARMHRLAVPAEGPLS